MTMTEVHPELGDARLPNNPLLSEVLAKVSKQRTKAKKVEVLKENDSLHLKAVLIWNFDDSVVSVLPEGEVPFEKNEAPAGTEHTYLAHEWRVLYNRNRSSEQMESIIDNHNFCCRSSRKVANVCLTL